MINFLDSFFLLVYQRSQKRDGSGVFSASLALSYCFYLLSFPVFGLGGELVGIGFPSGYFFLILWGIYFFAIFAVYDNRINVIMKRKILPMSFKMFFLFLFSLHFLFLAAMVLISMCMADSFDLKFSVS